MSVKQGFVYLMMNPTNTVIYAGVTSDLKKRIYEHRFKILDGFTARYNANKLVYYEVYDDISYAIQREKQIKGGSRAQKVKLIKSVNPGFNDLYEEI